MRQVIRHIILLTSLLLIEVTSSAQGVSTFPVQVTTQVMSPSVYLTDYESGFEERVSVILLNRDVMSTGVDVRLRLTIKCQNGLTLRTKPSAVFEAISLYPGSPERLGMSDLSPYFDVRNLDVNGSLVQGMLPEGLATFTFEAVEYHTGVVVSTQGVAVTNLTMNKPPALLFPMDRSVINSRAARSVLFQWQPCHTYTQEGVTYEITLKEIADTLANPTSAYNYSQSIYQTETTSTSLIYSVSEPPLEAGKRYGWCVRAYRADGTGGSFTNGGYSEVFTFDVRETPLDNQTDVKDSISDTPVKKQEKDYSHCGEDNYRVTNLTPTDALEVGDTITVGGGFNVVLTTLRQSGYLYSGEGYMYIPYVGLTFAVDFNGIKVNTDKQLIEGYTEVRRDASKAQIGGTDAILQGGANRLKNGVLLPDVTVDFNMEDASGADYDSVSNTVTVYDEEGSKLGSFTVPQNETGESVFPVTVKDKEGNIVRIDEETDADGKPTGKYKFTPLGSQSAGQHVSEQTLSTLRSDLGSVDFEENADGIYTFDQPLDYYETVSLLLNSDGANGGGRIYRKVSGYDVPWLFIAEGGTESVRAKLTLTKSGKSEIKHPENITFIINDEGGVITLPSEYDAADNTYSVRVSASQADSRQTVYALYQSGDQSHTLGQLDVDTRAPLTAKVCLVNLGGKYDKSHIETNINAIYQRVGVTWSVEEENGFMYPKEKLESLFDKKSGALELYNENQKSLNKAFEAYLGDRYDGKTCYLFMMPANGSGSERDLAGFMPRGEQYGYINTDVILQEQMPAVIAHELGHGKFRLRHTFDSEYGKGAESKKGKTENLMDYAPTPSKATHIAKWQWNQIHNPALLTELWEKDEDSEWTTDGHYYLFTYLGMLMGMDYATAEQYGRWAEEPDSHVYDDGKMSENITWMIGGLQQRNHALTGGYHGVELMATVYAIKHFLNDENQKYLFHRFGDCFAHFDISNDAKGFNDVQINRYIKAFDDILKDNVLYVNPETEYTFSNGVRRIIKENQIVIDSESSGKQLITSLDKNSLAKNICQIVIRSSDKNGQLKGLYPIVQIGYSPSANTPIYSQELNIIDNLERFILKHLPPATQNSYRMYGDDANGCFAFTWGHSRDDSKPDQIVTRPDLFKFYAKKVTELLVEIGKGDLSKQENALSQVNSVVNWAVSTGEEKLRLDGIWALNICLLKAQMEGNTSKTLTFKIPIKWLPDELKNLKSNIYYEWINPFFNRDFKSINEENEGFTKDSENQLDYLKSFLLYDNYQFMKKYSIESVTAQRSTNVQYILLKVNIDK